MREKRGQSDREQHNAKVPDPIRTQGYHRTHPAPAIQQDHHTNGGGHANTDGRANTAAPALQSQCHPPPQCHPPICDAPTHHHDEGE